jgi:hypothetical protein
VDVLCGAPSLTRGRVYSLQLLLVLTSAVILGSESRKTHDHISLSQIQNSRNLEGHIPVFISPKKKVAYIYPPDTGLTSPAISIGDICVGTSHMSDNQQMTIAMQRLADFISMVTNRTLLRNNTRAVTTMERNCDFCWVRLNITTGGSISIISTKIQRCNLGL